MIKRSILSLVLFFAAGSASQAAIFYAIASATSDRSATDLWPASNLIQGPGVGYDAAEPHASLGVTDSTTAWVTDAPNGGAGDFFNPAVTPAARIVFDLGLSVVLGEISIWGYNSTNANGATDVNLRFSDTPTFAGAAFSISGIGLDPIPRQSFTFPTVTARYVELVPTDNFFGAGPPGGDRVGLKEVAFEVVPEPSGLLLALIGVSAIALRRRR